MNYINGFNKGNIFAIVGKVVFEIAYETAATL